MVTKLKPGAVHSPHWHPNANEWHYVAKGRTRVMLFASDKRMAEAKLSAGDCAYIPRGCGRLIQNIGSEDCEIAAALDNGVNSEALLADWIDQSATPIAGEQSWAAGENLRASER